MKKKQEKRHNIFQKYFERDLYKMAKEFQVKEENKLSNITQYFIF